MSDECIHGFEVGMCATCFPKPVAEVPVELVAQTRATRSGSSSRRTATATRPRTRAATGSAPLDDVRQQRAYHLTHVRNLPAILADGALRAGATPEVDISPVEARAERRGIEIPGADAALADYVPFFLSPNAHLWHSIRSRRAHPRVSRDIRGSDPADFVLLVVTVRGLSDAGHGFVVTDGNAEGSLTRFASTQDDIERTLRRIRADASQEAVLDAELLVPGALPFEEISLIGVAHDKARAIVREILQSADYTPKVAVYPPWFANDEG